MLPEKSFPLTPGLNSPSGGHAISIVGLVVSRVDPPALAHVSVRNTWSQQYAAFTFGLHFVTHGAFTCTLVTSVEKLFPL